MPSATTSPGRRCTRATCFTSPSPCTTPGLRMAATPRRGCWGTRSPVFAASSTGWSPPPTCRRRARRRSATPPTACSCTATRTPRASKRPCRGSTPSSPATGTIRESPRPTTPAAPRPPWGTTSPVASSTSACRTGPTRRTATPTATTSRSIPPCTPPCAATAKSSIRTAGSRSSSRSSSIRPTWCTTGNSRISTARSGAG